MQVPISQLEVHQKVQLRSRWVDEDTVAAYVEALAGGAEFPPIVAYYDGDTYWVADGFHRIAAYRFVGLAEIETEVHEGTREDAMVYAAIANVTNGKPMGQKEKREAGERLLKLTGWPDREIARRLAVNNATVTRWRQSLSVANATDTPATRTVTRNGTTYEMDVSNIGGSKDGNQPQEETQPDLFSEEQESAPLTQAEWPNSIELIHGDFRKIGQSLTPNSFDLIITDPPYGEENTHFYGELAKLAARVLKPGGSLLAMAGQLCIPNILNLMTPHLSYHWTISYDTPGGQSPQIWTRKVNTFWKPVFWFVKGEYDGAWRGDKIKSNKKDKRFHAWGQSESGIGKLISEFASVGTGKVLDPFVGGGTMAVVCYRLKIPFVGIDIDLEAIETTKERIKGLIRDGN